MDFPTNFMAGVEKTTIFIIALWSRKAIQLNALQPILPDSRCSLMTRYEKLLQIDLHLMMWLQAEANKDKDVILEETKESNEDEDGLTSLDYQVVASEKLPLYTWLLVKLPPAPPKRPPVTQSPFSNLLNGLAGQLTQGLLQELLPKPEQSSSEEEIEYQVY